MISSYLKWFKIEFFYRKRFFDKGMMRAVIILSIFSLLFVYSATYKADGFYYLKKEIFWLIVGYITFFIFSTLDYRWYARIAWPLYIFNILMLGSVYAIGKSAKGAQRWISVGGIQIQPSEFAKILILITLITLIAKNYPKGIKGFRDIGRTFLHVFPAFILILKQPDLGTALIVLFLYCFIIFAYEVNIKKLLCLFVVILAMVPGFFHFLKPFQKARLLVFLDPDKYSQGAGWNVIQAKIAVGSGGLFGQGIFHGTQNQLNFLPESHTDFIFGVIAEEIGFIGSTVLILVYLYIIVRLLSYARQVDDVFGRLFIYGAAVIIFCHTFINIGMVIGIIPAVGVPLILMSYGGTSFILFFMLIGISQNIISRNAGK
ncbi:MAG: rod shape-determining protein RodA [Fusobacteria bacterium]|nr:rod shape-determining protein RodA [Fusobacteriota bacterium]